ncbi:cutinase family protein [Nocardia terpenica]|uniref:cutinase family protein n=1 Tax=Nocardia terpenica TaxID=455432 RepID=UPI001895ED43|nr:cutinase family protein [Nocardia terpenica]MBF6061995.1 cutinase family protein [Nocardia terpenica]MBF6106205.1 cutinase family protein [Nocardia terpenica]MBF6110415.1 cutinase family protein [Nocardia terpenica]MBF6120748.1 cutinase family protein [Nocardia terpenica]MBF6151751.1 cutinase family protein [Nocardia terpenica]
MNSIAGLRNSMARSFGRRFLRGFRRRSGERRAVVTVITATVVIAGVGRGVAIADSGDGGASEARGCPVVVGVFLPGTWETNPQADESRPVGLLAPVATQLKQRFGERFEFRFPAYAAAAFDRMPYGDSKATGVAAVRRVLSDVGKRCPATKFVLAGYSQGSDAVGDVAASIGCSGDPVAADRVLAVGLIADPHRGQAGGKLVGPQVAGQGIAGARSGGLCQLSAVTAEICAGQDLYCSTDVAQHPILSGLGRMLSAPTDPPGRGDSGGGGGGPDSTDLAKSLVSNFGDVQLAQIPSTVQQMIAQIGSGHPDPGQLARSVDTVTGSLRPLGDLAAWATSSPGAQSRLSSAADGSPDRLAGQVLDAASRSDLPGALDSLASIGSQIASTAAGHASPPDLAADANKLGSATSPLNDALSNTPAEALGDASRVLSVLKPSVLVDQVTNVAINGLRFAANIPSLLDVLNQVVHLIGDPGTDVAGKVRGLHELFGKVNAGFEPLVRMAAGVDLHLVSQLIGLIPDPQGTAQIVSVLVGVLANLDVAALAKQVGRLQENLWQLAEAFASGVNLVDLATRATAFIPTVLGFATLAVNTLTGAPKSGDVGGGQDVAGLAQSLTGKQATQGADALAQLASEGLSAASFFASGVHQGYDHYVVDGQGRTATQWLTDWFSNRIRSLGAQ